MENLQTFNTKKDINSTKLFYKILAFKDIFGLLEQNQIETISFLNRNHLPLPNLAISLCILLTIPISVSSREYSFSKLIKIDLRFSWSQERFKNLAMFSIENNICEELGFKQLISTFINLKIGKN